METGIVCSWLLLEIGFQISLRFLSLGSSLIHVLAAPSPCLPLALLVDLFEYLRTLRTFSTLLNFFKKLIWFTIHKLVNVQQEEKRWKTWLNLAPRESFICPEQDSFKLPLLCVFCSSLVFFSFSLTKLLIQTGFAYSVCVFKFFVVPDFPPASFCLLKVPLLDRNACILYVGGCSFWLYDQVLFLFSPSISSLFLSVWQFRGCKIRVSSSQGKVL